MFKVKCIADDEEFEMAFVPKMDPMSSAETWLSTDGTIVVQAGVTGGWGAYRMPGWEKLSVVNRYASKEQAAFAACQHWVN